MRMSILRTPFLACLLAIVTTSTQTQNVRHSRVVNRPAALERPDHACVHEPPNDVSLRAIYSKPPLFLAWHQLLAYIGWEAVVPAALPGRDDQVRTQRFDGVECLYKLAI
jgi:hypothetical protein